MNILPVVGWENKIATVKIPRECPCNSWKKHWTRFSREPWPTTCFVRDCNEDAEEGAHVYNKEPYGEWIVPMCHPHNETTKTLNLKDGVTLVNANTSDTCENTSNRQPSKPVVAKTGVWVPGYEPERVTNGLKRLNLLTNGG